MATSAQKSVEGNKFGIAMKLGILLAAFGVLAGGFTGYYTYQTTRDILIRESSGDLLQSSRVLGLQFSAMVDGIAQDARLLAKIPGVPDAVGTGQDAAISRRTLSEQFRNLLMEHPEYFQARFISAEHNGIELVRVDRASDGIKIVSGADLQEKLHYPYVFETLKLTAGQVHFSRIFINRERGVHAGLKQPTLQVATPVAGKDGKTLGVIVLNVDLSHLFNLLKTDFGSEYQLYLANQAGDYLIHPDSAMTFGFDYGRRFLVQETFKPVAAIIDSDAETATVYTSSAKPHTDVIGGFSRIPFGKQTGRSFVIIGLTVPLDVVLAETDALAKNSSLIVIGFSLLGTILSILLVLFFIRPLKRLAEAVKRFSETRELTLLPAYGNDEIGILASSIGQMQEHTVAYLNDLNLRNEEMEQRAKQDALTMAELKHLEEQKEEALYRLQKIASQLPGIVFQFRLRPDGTACLPYASEAIRDIYRFGPEAVREDIAPLFAAVHPDDLPGYLASIEEAAKNLTPWHHEFRLKFAGEPDIWLLGNAIPQLEEDGSVLAHGFTTDITERKQAELELLAAKQAAENASIEKSRFLAAASHDLRQPIQAINLFNDALGRTGLNEEQKDIRHYLTQAINTLGDILNALLDISKLDAGVIKPCPSEMLPGELFGKLEAEFSAVALKKNLRFKFHYPRNGAKLFADPNLLLSLLGNLLGNAVKFTGQGGILVSLRRRGNRALIQVWDTGIGIAPNDMDHIFKEYFQVGNAARDRTQGLGLGLAIAKRMANLLNTELSCRSRLNKGSVFEFSLPLADGSENRELCKTGADCNPANNAFSLTGCKVVIVEDDFLIANALKFSLESLGMSVAAFGNAEDALADAEIANADFYISDYRLPGMNGVQLLDAMQRRSKEPINAVLLTGDMSPVSTPLTSPTWAVLLKPVKLKQLLAAMELQYSKRETKPE